MPNPLRQGWLYALCGGAVLSFMFCVAVAYKTAMAFLDQELGP